MRIDYIMYYKEREGNIYRKETFNNGENLVCIRMAPINS